MSEKQNYCNCKKCKERYWQKSNNDRNDHKTNCKGCVCNELRKLQTQTEVDVFLSGGQILEDVVFISLNPKNCCAFFVDNETEPGSTLIVDCEKIQAIRIEAD
ncbi:hydrolase [Bacillus sp. AFS015802]|uniref:hydrolase n=1 Tax=Bacillus sp. AFS015802 TaxID=2033486 RepID=UPI000BF72EAC|nr:hydrolase [Bacillus sp. AFS015802]PFA69780.1 hydrolase [Bacillus sp. AFS015802]